MNNSNQPPPTSDKKRLLSLDVFRGLTVAAMILVNNPGDDSHVYAPLEHAKWNGCTPTDLIFPSFLFIVGVSIVFAMDSKKAQTANHSGMLLSVIRRTLILIGLGIFLSLYPMFNFHTVRIPGVLQRIGLVYGIGGLLFIKTKPKTQFVLFWLFLVSYYLLMTRMPVPGTGHASLDPESNIGAWLDRSLLGGHLWKHSKTWDPEGLLGTIPALSTCLFGMLTGWWLKRKDLTNSIKVTRLLLTGAIAVILGLLWNLTFPINKSLWTSSFVLFAGGIGAMALAVLYWLIDVKQYRRFTKPFVVYGVNAITVFFLSGIIARTLLNIKISNRGNTTNLQVYLYRLLFEPFFSPVNASLAMAIAWVLFWFGILWMMYSKKIFIKV